MVSMKSNMSQAEMRYRKFQRRNPLRKLSLQIDEVIMEEDEEALEHEADQDYQSINYSSLPPLHENEETKSAASGSDDEFGKYRHVIGDSNFADEILSEIYGATPSNKDNNIELSENHDDNTEEYDGNRSLADEILDELYGTAPINDENREASPEYCNIDDIRSQESLDTVQGDQDVTEQEEDDNHQGECRDKTPAALSGRS